ncbi:MAG TPA: hypothetical protein VMU76_05845 [Acidimicrobiales bacterium]|nr:hypothetical protein [Acidimicrobiales bacterium]
MSGGEGPVELHRALCHVLLRTVELVVGVHARGILVATGAISLSRPRRL